MGNCLWYLYGALLFSSPASRYFVVSTSLVTAPFIFSVTTGALPVVMASIFSSATLKCLRASIITFIVSPFMIVQGICALNCLLPDPVCMMFLCKKINSGRGVKTVMQGTTTKHHSPGPMLLRHFPSSVHSPSHQGRKRKHK